MMLWSKAKWGRGSGGGALSPLLCTTPRHKGGKVSEVPSFITSKACTLHTAPFVQVSMYLYSSQHRRHRMLGQGVQQVWLQGFNNHCRNRQCAKGTGDVCCTGSTHKLYLESRSHAWARWRREFTKRQNASGTKLMRAHRYRMEHLYNEAVARVVARHTYDENNCRTLTETPSHM